MPFASLSICSVSTCDAVARLSGTSAKRVMNKVVECHIGNSLYERTRCSGFTASQFVERGTCSHSERDQPYVKLIVYWTGCTHKPVSVCFVPCYVVITRSCSVAYDVVAAPMCHAAGELVNSCLCLVCADLGEAL